jgi:cytoskeletal protein RodZ
MSLGRSLEDAERQTRILVRHLAALEAGEFEQLPPGIYARGFVHNYAAYLRLNPQEMLRLFNESRGENETYYRLQPVAQPMSTAGPISPNFVVIVFVVGMLAVVTAWGYTLLVQPPPPRPVSTEPTAANATPTSIIGRTVAAPTITTSSGGLTVGGSAMVATPAAPPSATPVTQFKVTLKATEKVYFKVKVDGQVIKEGFLQRGETLDIPAGKSVKIFCGSPGAITHTVNGVDRGPLPPEAYRNMPDGYEVKDVSPNG